MSKKSSSVSNVIRSDGNLEFKHGHYGEALECYNASLCFAEPEGDSLALAYANKSSVCIECKEFDACLLNIQLAKDHNYPQNKMAVLDERKSRCLKLMESNMDEGNHLEFIKLTYPANNKIPFIVESLELKTNERYGQHIVTNKDLKVGDIVAFDKPFCASSGEGYGLCATCCNKQNTILYPCTCCTTAMFCSKACEELALKTFHNPKCDSYKSSCVARRVAWRMYFQATELFDGSFKDLQDFLCANESSRKSIFELDFSNSNEVENDKNRLLALFAFLDEDDKKSCKSLNKTQFEEYLWFQVYKVAKKCTTVIDDNCHALYVFGPLLNHSCAPNLVEMQLGTTSLYFVIRPISKGQQLFKSYGVIYTSDSREVRRDTLLRQFKFECECEACRRNYRTMFELARASRSRLMTLPSWPKLNRSGTVALAIERYKHYSAMLQSSPELTVNNYNGMLITGIINLCLMKITAYDPFNLKQVIHP